MAFAKLADRLLNRLVPQTGASAAPDCQVYTEVTGIGCGPGKYRLRKRQCCVGTGCTPWIYYGGCAVP
ncbi:hypothetical protein Afil01_32090 [Actinorhabdospora filicis]|uniref:Uncharacterized protein n=1 Tax=Actinorhabdospora filicis TaxID=1785913 RepID=A0A9W6SM20_9ACTN|nr:hypothetical protein [Actinorhabdospora filicis]GLZ78402.1 hypothetical protein Afil01_32090 [Actinorhabdospora filicis]